jgi:hypothetical protein
MSATLFFALVGVYVLGIAGVVAAGSIVESPPDDPGGLEDRLARVRENVEPEGTIIARRSRRADAGTARRGAVESIARAFTPVGTRRMRSDVATSGPLRSAHPH